MLGLLRHALVLLSFPPILPVVLILRLLRPVVIIRFGRLPSERIGHFTAHTEVYLCERDAGMHGSRTVDIFYHHSPICNKQLKKMWNRTLIASGSASWVDRVNRRVPGYERHVIPWREYQDHDIHGLLANTEPHLRFTEEEEVRGQAALRKMGIPEGVEFVCFYARDPAYLDTLRGGGVWHYHDYRDSSIHDYLPAMEEMTHRGYFAVRMGALVEEALDTSNTMIVDYATNGTRTDFLDIYLAAKCRFFLGDTAGIWGMTVPFRKPMAFVNYVPLGIIHSWNPYDLSILKNLWQRKEKQYMAFRQILESPIARSLKTEEYEELGLDLIENTPEEITALATEMDERLNGSWQTTEEDEELQRRLWSLFQPNDVHGALRSRVGAEFLRQSRELLD